MVDSFDGTVWRTLEEIVSCGERLSNDAEARAFDALEAAFRRAGAATARESIPIFTSLSDARISVGGRTFESPDAEGNAMTHPLEAGACGTFDIEAQGPLVVLDECARRALLSGEAQAASALRGAVLLASGLPALGLLRAAERAGAAGVLFNTGERVRRMIVSDLWGSPAKAADFDRYVTIPNASVTDALARTLRPGEVVKLQNRVRSGWCASTVLTGAVGCPPRIEAACETSSPIFLMTGHMDSWGAGAVDNASGLAVMTGVLESLARSAREKGAPRAGAMAVVWSGHSHGRYAGSTAWSERHSAALEAGVFLNINVDCLGMRESVVTGRLPTAAAAERLAARSLQDAGIAATLAPQRFSRSCDQSFFAAGIPTVFSNVAEVPPEKSAVSLAVAGLGGVYGPCWHTRCDELDAVDRQALIRDGRIILRAAEIAAVEGIDALDLDAEAEALAEDMAVALAGAKRSLAQARALCSPEAAAVLDAFINSEALWQALEGAPEAVRRLGAEYAENAANAADAAQKLRMLHALLRAGYMADETGFGLAGRPARNRLAEAVDAFDRTCAALERLAETGAPQAMIDMRLLTSANGLHREAVLFARALRADFGLASPQGQLG